MKEENNIIIPFEATAVKEMRHKAIMDMWQNPAEMNNTIFQHSIFCQVYYPYRDLGNDVRLWRHSQGKLSINIQSLEEENRRTNEMVHFGIPFGTKARLITAYLNSQAIKEGSKIIDVEGTLSSFIDAIGLSVNGKNIADVKNQLARIASSVITLNYFDGNTALNTRFLLIKSYDVFFPKDDRQRVLWMPHIELTDDYFNQLEKHAVPLDERALAALKNNAMALDIYAWLAQRLHRISKTKPQFITWAALKAQFGVGYNRMDKFKSVFRHTLSVVKMQYKDAKISEEINKGFWLENSATAIPKKTIIILDQPKDTPK
jgi:hypothetical protein